MKKLLLAVSGGPDSMLLLDLYKKKDIVVAHVNYHKREDSNNDERIVREFCEKHNITFEVLNVKKAPKSNFQSWARKIRYDFFKKLYTKYQCEQLLMAHHNDDFLETAIMQMESGRTPRYFGIKENNVIDGMNIHRPFIYLYWKSEILAMLEKKNMEYAIDSSNAEPLFERNKVRLELEKMPFKEKRSRMQWFHMSNKILKKKFKRVDKNYAKWSEKNFELDFFRNLHKDKEEIVYEFVHANFKSVKLSSGKIKSLVDFIMGEEGNKSFALNTKSKVTKKEGFLKLG